MYNTSFKTKVNGTDKALVNKIRETMTPEEAISENPDNAIDSGAKNVYLTYNEMEDFLKSYNDGKPFKDIEEYFEEFVCNRKHEIGDIGSLNQGSKQSAACLLDSNVGIMHVFSPVPNKQYCKHGMLRFNMLDKENPITSCVEALIYDTDDFKTYDDKYGIEKSGVTFIYQNLIDGADEHINNFLKKASMCYGLCNYKNDFQIHYNGKKISYKDPLFLRILGKDIEKDGIYFKDGHIFYVTTLHFEFDGEERRVKIVALYLTRSKYNDASDIPDFTGLATNGGIYTFIGNRMMDCGGNILEMFGTDCDSYSSIRGGVDRVRVGIFCDGNNDVFQIKSNKSQGIERLCKNTIIRDMCESLIERKWKEKVGNRNYKYVSTKFSLYKEILHIVKAFLKINVFNAKQGNEIFNFNDDAIKQFLEGEKSPFVANSAESCVSSVSEINASDILNANFGHDPLTAMIDGCQYATQMVKEIMYCILNDLAPSKREKNIKKIIEICKKYDDTKSVYKDKREQSVCECRVC